MPTWWLAGCTLPHRRGAPNNLCTPHRPPSHRSHCLSCRDDKLLPLWCLPVGPHWLHSLSLVVSQAPWSVCRHPSVNCVHHVGLYTCIHSIADQFFSYLDPANVAMLRIITLLFKDFFSAWLVEGLEMSGCRSVVSSVTLLLGKQEKHHCSKH